MRPLPPHLHPRGATRLHPGVHILTLTLLSFKLIVTLKNLKVQA